MTKRQEFYSEYVRLSVRGVIAAQQYARVMIEARGVLLNQGQSPPSRLAELDELVKIHSTAQRETFIARSECGACIVLFGQPAVVEATNKLETTFTALSGVAFELGPNSVIVTGDVPRLKAKLLDVTEALNEFSTAARAELRVMTLSKQLDTIVPHKADTAMRELLTRIWEPVTAEIRTSVQGIPE